MDTQIQTKSGNPSKISLALTSIVIGIVSILISIILLVNLGPLGTIIGIIVSTVGIVFGMKSINSRNKGFAITGIIISAFSVVVHLYFLSLGEKFVYCESSLFRCIGLISS
ncbi:hypothetical protein [Shimazuella kribbensis]|uniref:hypothetical protein n=1 Tax=Shimazuella kribbensis TaxID=139808 RepID=UPI00048EE5A0|nr:hypothetical protein [Shimazuella kribbensis]